MLRCYSSYFKRNKQMRPKSSLKRWVSYVLWMDLLPQSHSLKTKQKNAEEQQSHQMKPSSIIQRPNSTETTKFSLQNTNRNARTDLGQHNTKSILKTRKIPQINICTQNPTGTRLNSITRIWERDRIVLPPGKQMQRP